MDTLDIKRCPSRRLEGEPCRLKTTSNKKSSRRKVSLKRQPRLGSLVGKRRRLKATSIEVCSKETASPKGDSDRGVQWGKGVAERRYRSGCLVGEWGRSKATSIGARSKAQTVSLKGDFDRGIQ